MICPSDAASAIRSPSSGVTSSVTTVEGIGVPSLAFSWSYRVPAVSTWTLPTTIRVMLFFPAAGPEGDHHVDARTRDDEAGDAHDLVHLHGDGPHARRNRRRQPGAGLRAARACFRSAARSRRSVAIKPRLTTSSTLVKDPGTGLLAGHFTTLT